MPPPAKTLQPLHAFLIHLTEKNGKKRWSTNDPSLKKSVEELHANTRRFQPNPPVPKRAKRGKFLQHPY